MKLRKAQVILINGLIMTLFVSFSGCIKDKLLEEKNDKAVVTFVLGDVTIENSSGSHAARVRDVLTDNDIISTGKNSYMVVQMGSRLMFRVQSGSIVEMASILNYGQDEISLKKGLVLSKISRLKKGEKYNIKTPTVVASVRGTVFSTGYYENDVTNIAVTEGEVVVKHLTSEEEKPANAGNAAYVSDGEVEIREIDKVEKLTLQKLENIEYIEDIDSVSDEELSVIGKEISENDIRIDREINKFLKEKNTLTLNEIKEKYGRIDLVRLYNGKTYKGAILSRGSRIKMITPSGTIYISAKNIKQTESL
ncbi:MAG: FecR domain-containing protein [Spirochaetes bacterium]|nr:FecR domain-containing protein [Spirochaetota bacterium]